MIQMNGGDWFLIWGAALAYANDRHDIALFDALNRVNEENNITIVGQAPTVDGYVVMDEEIHPQLDGIVEAFHNRNSKRE